jgi:uncharacterized protein (TIGR02145 family)
MRKFTPLSIALFLLYTSSCKKDDVTLKKMIPTEVVAGASGTTSGLKYGKMTDIDGNVYKTIQIGKQIWMAENLRVTKYRNGNSINNYTSDVDWSNSTSGCWCYYNNDNTLNTTYGKIYNWYAITDSRGLAPKGWHIPNDSEWTALNDYLGTDAGTKLKSISTWSFSGNGTNSSGFNGVANGDRSNTGVFTNLGISGSMWTNTETSLDSAWVRYLYFGFNTLTAAPQLKKWGMAVRCIKD